MISDRFRHLLSNIHKSPDNTVFSELIAYAESGMTKEEIARLAHTLATSGQVLNAKPNALVADIPSTGGPSSLSTLITPLFLVQFGFLVPKLGVPGRPAGGIDVLAQIDGYNINPKLPILASWLKRSKYVHFIGDTEYAPIDIKLFEYRKSVNKIAIPSLVIASILSKKIAVGLNHTGLDVRVSSFGNFGTSWIDAKNNAATFVRVAKLLNINATCFLTNSNQPFQPFIGRGEALLALKELFQESEKNDWLLGHVTECFAMAKSITRLKSEDAVFSIERIRNSFIENVELQGGTMDSFDRITENVKINHSNQIIAEKDGFVRIDLLGIRTAIVSIQSKLISKENFFPDPCGIVLKVRAGSFVHKGTVLCTYRCLINFEREFRKNISSSVFTEDTRYLTHEFEEVK